VGAIGFAENQYAGVSACAIAMGATTLTQAIAWVRSIGLRR
jgi:hypothetical protein